MSLVARVSSGCSCAKACLQAHIAALEVFDDQHLIRISILSRITKVILAKIHMPCLISNLIQLRNDTRQIFPSLAPLSICSSEALLSAAHGLSSTFSVLTSTGDLMPHSAYITMFLRPSSLFVSQIYMVSEVHGLARSLLLVVAEVNWVASICLCTLLYTKLESFEFQ